METIKSWEEGRETKNPEDGVHECVLTLDGALSIIKIYIITLLLRLRIVCPTYLMHL